MGRCRWGACGSQEKIASILYNFNFMSKCRERAWTKCMDKTRFVLETLGHLCETSMSVFWLPRGRRSPLVHFHFPCNNGFQIQNRRGRWCFAAVFSSNMFSNTHWELKEPLKQMEVFALIDTNPNGNERK